MEHTMNIPYGYSFCITFGWLRLLYPITLRTLFSLGIVSLIIRYLILFKIGISPLLYGCCFLWLNT